MLLRGSITCPPCSSRSYFGAAATCASRTSSRQARARHAKTEIDCGSDDCRLVALFDSRLLRLTRRLAVHLAPRYSPMSSSPDIPSPDAFPVNVNDSESPPCAVVAAQAHVAAADRSREIARDEITLMRAVDVVALLPEVQDVRRRPGGVFDAHVPSTRQIDRRRTRRRGQDRAASATRAAHAAGPR